MKIHKITQYDPIGVTLSTKTHPIYYSLDEYETVNPRKYMKFGKCQLVPGICTPKLYRFMGLYNKAKQNCIVL